jgi:hypothetical protein
MTVISPIASVQAGTAHGGGFLDSIKSAIGMPTSQTTQQTGDGSVGLFDGVLKKALMGGAVGAAAGFLPFIPGGPVLGGIVGALGGAAMGVFTNWRKQTQIKQENEAMLAALGVQTSDPNVQQILKSGNVEQLIPYLQGQATQQATQQSAGTTVITAEQMAAPPTLTPIPVQGAAATGGGSVSGASSGAQSLNASQASRKIAELQQQIDLLTSMLESEERRDRARAQALAS